MAVFTENIKRDKVSIRLNRQVLRFMSCVVLFSKNTIYRESLEQIINKVNFIDSVIAVNDGTHLKEVITLNNPDFIIIDLYSRNFEEEALAQILKSTEGAKIILITTIENTHINYYNYAYGIKYFIHAEDSSENIICILDKIFNGNVSSDKFKSSANILTSRECEILKLIASGRTSKEIAEKLCISKNTVDTHRNKMLMKLDLSNSASLVYYAYKSGLF